MVTKKNLIASGLPCALLCAALVGVTGCGPPGASAFKRGERLMEQGNYNAAVGEFSEAARLMATNARAWNCLGLACQHAGQADAAAEAYNKALKYDRNLFIVHYNLGCLFLEQNKPEKLEAARNSLTAYTQLQSGSAPGWVKLGTAQLRLRALADAETSFKKALRFSPDDPEALNGLGLVELGRNRYRDAAGYFNTALAHQPKYAPALLNLAVISQTYLNNHALALQKYQEYLALEPRPANWEAVAAAARQLDQELNPPRPAAIPPPAARAVTNNPANVAANATNPARPETPVNPPRATVVAPPAQPVHAEIVQLPETPAVRVAGSGPPVNAGDAAASNQIPDEMTPADAAKPGFLQRMNPFRRDPKAVPTPTPLPEADTGAAARSATVELGALPLARYTYVSPPKPAEGNRSRAEQLFSQAAEAQHDRRLQDAEALYRAATQADAAYFEAQSNLGLAAFDLGDLTQSLLAYETALAIRPDSFSARFNFALALRKAGYPVDSARELERLLAKSPPGESPAHLALAHLTLANLYADQFHRPAAARPHYSKVLELDPQNKEATAIRYWLRDNP